MSYTNIQIPRQWNKSAGLVLNTFSPVGGLVPLYDVITEWFDIYGGASGGSWGSITGTLSSQTDLQTALNAKESTANKGAVNGYASLDGSGLVPSSQLPSYVDDVVEYANLAALPVTGITGKIYVTLDTNKTYRWSGSAYIEISSTLPAGSNTQIQFNNSGVLGGSANLTWDGTNVTVIGNVLATRVDSGNSTSSAEWTYGPLASTNGFNALHQQPGDTNWRAWLSVKSGALSFGQADAAPAPADLRGYTARTNGSGVPQTKNVGDDLLQLAVQSHKGTTATGATDLTNFYSNSQGIKIMSSYVDTVTSGLSTAGIKFYFNTGTSGNTPTGTIGIQMKGDGTVFFTPANSAATTGTVTPLSHTSTFAAAAGSANFRPINIAYTINNSGAQSGTATGIFLNATETALNSMTHNLIDLQVGGSRKFSVNPISNGTEMRLGSNGGDVVFSVAGNTLTIGGVTNNHDVLLPGAKFQRLGVGYGVTFNQAGAVSLPIFTMTGTWFTGGTATTTKPALLIEPTSTTSNIWSTAGTGLGINAASGFTGNLVDLQVNAGSRFVITNGGAVTAAGSITSGGNLQLAGVANTITWASGTVLKAGADGNMILLNNAQSDFSRLQFGGSTSSFPAWKRFSATLQARLADDSDFAKVNVKQLLVDGTVIASGTTGDQTINKASGIVNIGAGNTFITVTNSLVTAGSSVFAQLQTDADPAVYILNVRVSLGSFTVNLSGSAAAEIPIAFFVVN